MKLAFGLTFIVASLSCNTFASGAFPRKKFETWFSSYGHHFEESSKNICNSTLQQYKNPPSDSPIPRFAIAHHADCILANTTETIKANMASAGVVLGLMPSLLSSLGPTPDEASTLVLERPLLSLLLAIGGPAFYPFRTSDHQDPLEALKEPFGPLPVMPSFRWAYVLIGLLQYLLALAAALNVVAVSLQLGLMTIVTWDKDQSYLPLIWVVLPLAILLCAAIRLHLFSKKKPSPEPSSRSCNLAISLFTAETRLCVMRERPEFETGDMTLLAHVFGAALPVIVVVHLFLGSMIFSSLLFISVDDAWPLLLRYSLSAAMAKVIRMFEIGGLYRAYSKTF